MPPSQPSPSFHSQPFCFQKATPAIVSGATFCALFNQTGRCTAGCPPKSHRCNRAVCGEPHPECHGFCPGYTGSHFSITPKNLKSASDNEAHVTDAIAKKLICWHIAGPFKTPLIHPLHCSPLGAIPQKDMSWCMILDLSSPKGLSVNEWISKDDFSVTFSKFDVAVNLVRVTGPGALMAKLDIKHAFRIMPVHPDDWDLLGTCWDGLYLVKLHLPFSGRSSVFISNTSADALTWILCIKHAVARLVHYLDDFFSCGRPNSSECACNIDTIRIVFDDLGMCH